MKTLEERRLRGIWNGMKQRCFNPISTNYKNYGGRGISVCTKWALCYQNFQDWALGNGYSDDLSIDRIDNDGSYEPENCRWATAKQQCNNRSTNTSITYNNETKTLQEWSDLINIPADTLSLRLRFRAWSLEEVFTRPLGARMQRTSSGAPTSNYRGVHRLKNRDSKQWVANIKIKGVQSPIGAFNEEKTAALAYREVSLAHGMDDALSTEIINEQQVKLAHQAKRIKELERRNTELYRLYSAASH